MLSGEKKNTLEISDEHALGLAKHTQEISAASSQGIVK